MREEVKRIRHAQEVVVTDGRRALLVVFEDGDWTWWYVEGNEELSALKDLVGRDVLITDEEDEPEEIGTIH